MTKEDLIKDLTRDGYLVSPAIIDAFRVAERINFVPEERKEEAYENYPLPIGFGQTISQPLTVAFMLELLEAKAGEKILDVGVGSGWQTALLSCIVGDQGRVIAIERIPELVALAEANIARCSLVTHGNMTLVAGDGAKGYETEAPFDRIVAAAGAERIQAAWKEQVKIGGRIVAPVKDSIFVLDKTGHNEFKTRQYFGFSFVPLVTAR